MREMNKKIIVLAMVITIFMSSILPATRSVSYAADGDGAVSAIIEFFTGGNDKANLFERVISKGITFATAQLYGLVGFATGRADEGRPLTIESLFFNQYSKTRLTIFDGMGKTNDYIESGIKETVNDFYKFFTSIAVIVYMIIIIYIGIRILLNTGTSNNAKYKEFLLYWVQGIAILFLFPYVMKYTIMINDTFVDFIHTNKENIYTLGDAVNQPGIEVSEDDGDLSDINKKHQSIHKSFMSGKDYLSIMYQRTFQTGWLVYAICFAIMAKQIISLIILYFKRLLIILFLIIIFPLVTISYAIDKLGDGKSQAFSNWCKEFVLNVFVQSFHAIVYIIGMAMILKLGDLGDNWLILMMLISFITKGDEILEHIFNVKGGSGTPPPNVLTSIVQTRAAIGVAEKVVQTGNRIVGKESYLGRTTRAIGQFSNNARDHYLNKWDLEEQQAARTVTPDIQPELSSPMTLFDAAEIALNENISEQERNEALDRILEVMNMEDSKEKEEALDKLAQMYANDPEKLKELEKMLKLRAAQNKIMLGGLTPIELTQQIEIVLECLKGSGLSGQMAQAINANNDLQKVKAANMVNFKRPEEDYADKLRGRTTSKKSGGRRKKGDRYSGEFVRSSLSGAKRQRALLRAEERAVRAQRRRDLFGGGNESGTSTAYKVSSAAGGRTLKQIRSELKGANKELKELEKRNQRGSTAYQRAQAKLQRAKARYDNLRSDRVKKGKVKAKIEQPGATYHDTTGAFAASKENKKIVKEQGKRRKEVYEKSGEYQRFEENRKKIAIERNSLKLMNKRLGNGPFRFSGEKTKAVGFGMKRVSAKDSINQGRKDGVSLNGAKTGVKSTKETSSSTKITQPTRIKKNPKMIDTNGDTSIHLAENPQATVREMANKRALKKAIMQEQPKTSALKDKFVEAYGGSEKIKINGESRKSFGLSSDIIELASKKNEEKVKMQITGKHDSSVPKGDKALPAEKGSTFSHERETIIWVKEDDKIQTTFSGKNVISLNSKAEYERAKKLVEEVKMNSKIKISDGTSTASSSSSFEKNIMNFAVSVTAISSSSSGEYTASEIIAHIDNIKAIMASYPEDSEEYESCMKILQKLERELGSFRDFESNVRIQVLNDPTLIADSDPNKSQIIDGSIQHVKKLDKDDILLSMLRYETSDLVDGETPIEKSHKKYQTVSSMAATGLVTGAEVARLQTAMEESLREKEYQDNLKQLEDEIAATSAEMKKNLKSIGKNAAGAALDFAINVPLATTAALMGVGVGGDSISTAAATAVTGYNLVDKAATGARHLGGAGVNFATSRIQSQFSERLNSSSNTSSKAPKDSSSRGETPSIIDLRKTELRGKTTLGSGASLSERAQKKNNE